MAKISHIILSSIILFLFQCCSRDKAGDKQLTVFKYNESSGITSIDPAFARNQANIWVVNQIYNCLVQLDSTLKVEPCIASDWDISNEGTLYTFKIRDDIYFHDSPCFTGGHGRKLTAHDAEYSLKRLQSSKLAAPGAWVLNSVLKINNELQIKALNDSILTISLASPFPPFLGMLSMQYCSIIPAEAVEYYGNDFRINPVGTGPFRFKLFKEGVKLVLVKNDNYFEKDKNGKQLPYLDAVSISFIIDKQSAFLEFVKGNLDFMSGLDASYKDEILNPTGTLRNKYTDRINLISQPYLNTEYLGFMYDESNPVMKNNPLNDIRVRKAINMGFDKKRMIRYLRNGIGTPGEHGFIPAGMPGYSEDAGFGYHYNPAAAARLLTEAGYPGGKGLPDITLSTNASYLDISQFIQSQLSQIGVNLKIDVSPPGTLRENIAQGRVAFFRGSWIADYPDAENYLSLFYSANKSPVGPNYTHYKNATYDRLYEKASGETNDSIRALMYRNMDSIVMSNAPVVILYYDQVLRFTRKNIVNLGSNPLNLLNLKNVIKR